MFFFTQVIAKYMKIEQSRTNFATPFGLSLYRGSTVLKKYAEKSKATTTVPAAPLTLIVICL